MEEEGDEVDGEVIFFGCQKASSSLVSLLKPNYNKQIIIESSSTSLSLSCSPVAAPLVFIPVSVSVVRATLTALFTVLASSNGDSVVDSIIAAKGVLVSEAVACIDPKAVVGFFGLLMSPRTGERSVSCEIQMIGTARVLFDGVSSSSQEKSSSG